METIRGQHALSHPNQDQSQWRQPLHQPSPTSKVQASTCSMHNHSPNPSCTLSYRIAGNIGGEFNLADWRICESTAKRHAVLLVPGVSD